MGTREIKFRVWNGEKMTDLIGLSAGELWTDCKYPIEQYTGMKDKNGVEIYEGDMVIYPTLHQNRPLPEQVIYSHQRGFYPLQEPVDYDEVYADGEEWEVVGNIHENPELLPND